MIVSKRWSITFLAGCLVLLAGAAEARTFSMVGSLREHCCTKLGIPTGSVMGSGNYTPFNPPGGQYGGVVNSFPQTAHPIPGGGTVSATGSNPANLTLPQGVIGTTAYYLDPANGASFWWLQTTATVYNEAAVFAKSGGPGNFVRCKGTSVCSTPGGGTQTNYNWRVVNTAGPNKFGGTMRQLGVLKGVAKFHPPAYASLNRNIYFSFTPDFKGGPISTTHANNNTIRFRTGSFPGGTGGTPAPIVPIHASGSGTTYTATIMFLSKGTGFPWTTGTAMVNATQPTAPFSYQSVTMSGYDNRTALGKGNIQLVSPMVYVATGGTGTSFPRMLRLRMRLGQDAPVPALSAGGFALVAGMMLLAIGFVVHRRR